jgi:hypothetical protein
MSKYRNWIVLVGFALSAVLAACAASDVQDALDVGATVAPALGADSGAVSEAHRVGSEALSGRSTMDFLELLAWAAGTVGAYFAASKGVKTYKARRRP